jgi:small-conductance mechanosensitive channel
LDSFLSTIRELPYFGLISSLVLVLIGLVILILIVQFLTKRLSRSIRDKDLRYRTRKSVEFVAYLAGALVILAALSERLNGLTVKIGIVGAGVALARKEVIVSIAGFFAITLANFHKPGDRVQIGGIRGDVIDVSLVRTTLMEMGDWVDGDLYNGRVVRITRASPTAATTS